MSVFNSRRHQHPASGRGSRGSAGACLINQLWSCWFNPNNALQNADTEIVGYWWTGVGDTTPSAVNWRLKTHIWSAWLASLVAYRLLEFHWHVNKIHPQKTYTMLITDEMLKIKDTLLTLEYTNIKKKDH